MWLCGVGGGGRWSWQGTAACERWQSTIGRSVPLGRRMVCGVGGGLISVGSGVWWSKNYRRAAVEKDMMRSVSPWSVIYLGGPTGRHAAARYGFLRLTASRWFLFSPVRKLLEHPISTPTAPSAPRWVRKHLRMAMWRDWTSAPWTGWTATRSRPSSPLWTHARWAWLSGSRRCAISLHRPLPALPLPAAYLRPTVLHPPCCAHPQPHLVVAALESDRLER